MGRSRCIQSNEQEFPYGGSKSISAKNLNNVKIARSYLPAMRPQPLSALERHKAHRTSLMAVLANQVSVVLLLVREVQVTLAAVVVIIRLDLVGAQFNLRWELSLAAGAAAFEHRR